MLCPNCKIDNPAGLRFCNQCGAQLSKICPQCTAENSAGAKFCSQCGASLDGLTKRAGEPQTRERGFEGERRHLTVLFCDLVGSTEIAAQLDPEEWQGDIPDYHGAGGGGIKRFGGYLAP